MLRLQQKKVVLRNASFVNERRVRKSEYDVKEKPGILGTDLYKKFTGKTGGHKMKIDGMSRQNILADQTGINQTTDSYSRNIQNQIANAQKQLQDLSSNEEMTLEEKMKKRQEIQKQISELNMQLRQHQMEQRREKQKDKGITMDDMLGGTKNNRNAKTGSGSTGFSNAGMAAMLSADNSLKQARVQGSVATRMEGRAGVLKMEIKLDAGRGASTETKEKELTDLEQKVQAASASQVSTLTDANKTMEEAAKEDQDTRENRKTENDTEKTEKPGNHTKKPDNHANKTEMSGNNTEKTDRNIDQVDEKSTNATGEVLLQTTYTPVDVRL